MCWGINIYIRFASNGLNQGLSIINRMHIILPPYIKWEDAAVTIRLP